MKRINISIIIIINIINIVVASITVNGKVDSVYCITVIVVIHNGIVVIIIVVILGKNVLY